MFNASKYPVAYEGSVKKIRTVKTATASRPGVYLFEYTDNYSVFDYGKMPDRLRHKGAAMAVLSAWLFERLEEPRNWRKLGKSDVWDVIRDPDLRDGLIGSKTFREMKRAGMKTHYRGLRDRNGRLLRTDALIEPTNLMEVTGVEIVPPERTVLSGKILWNYNHIHGGLKHCLIPLENVFRFGVPKGSSLLERMNDDPGYHKELGLMRKPREGAMLPRPVVELFSKLEPSDRHLPLETALNFSGLDNESFHSLLERTLLAAVFLMYAFSQAGIRLWDGKFEFVRSPEGIVLADAITPDELRLTVKGVQISKEPIRQYYRRYRAPFVKAVTEAKKIAAKTNRKISNIVKTDLGSPPAKMEAEFKKVMEAMYTGVTAEVTGLDVFGPVEPLSRTIKVISRFV
ncbi:phosphoribosylaminoimidazolesuccinocarboxamide synthase [Thermodesulfobacteriota bacterium]